MLNILSSDSIEVNSITGCRLNAGCTVVILLQIVAVLIAQGRFCRAFLQDIRMIAALSKHNILKVKSVSILRCIEHKLFKELRIDAKVFIRMYDRATQ